MKEKKEMKDLLVKIYERNNFVFKGDRELVVDATLTEISDMITHMLNQLYEIKNNQI